MFNLILLIKTAGYAGIFGIIFVETGVFFGFFFPGDTLLFSAGVLAYEHYFDLPVVIVVLSVAAITGGFFGYWTGKKIGPHIFTREDSLFFKKAHVLRAKTFFNKHGNKTIFLSRYIPIVRTFAPTVAGVAQMRFKNFVINNILGGVAWCVTITLLGYYLGQKIPNIDTYLLPAVAFVCSVSFAPIAIEVFKRKKKTELKL